MIHQITDGMLTLDDFEVPQCCCLRPVEHNEKRQGVQEGDITLHYIKNKDTGERRLVLPQDVKRVRTLILGLDECSVGTAGVAGAAFHLKKMLWVKLDKIHRIIRDLKLAEGHCCANLFEKTKLWSAYLFGLNQRQFGSGTDFSLKKGLLNTFEHGVSVDGLANRLESNSDDR